ncbi:unnamed protein product, partial [Polarella glacialis]
ASYGRRGLSGMKGGKAETAMSSERLANFKGKQFETLEVFRKCQQDATWDRIHRGHFDWWMFPIDDGSKPDFNVNSEADVVALRSDSEWRERYHEGLALVAASWGWDVAACSRIEPPAPGMAYSGWDVRLAKMCRSLYLFEEDTLLSSMQTFAREVQQKEKGGASFFYGRICLDELLYFQLPRR